MLVSQAHFRRVLPTSMTKIIPLPCLAPPIAIKRGKDNIVQRPISCGGPRYRTNPTGPRGNLRKSRSCCACQIERAHLLLPRDMNRDIQKAKTGISGLDDVLEGGFARGHLYLVEGEPGAGKTTLGLQFLLAGAEAGERCLYITLSETEAELRDGAASHGWALATQIEVCELLPPESLLAGEQQQSLLYASDLELGETTNQIFEAVEAGEAQPDRPRQPVGNPAPGAKFAALPPADSRHQALFRAARHDGADVG